MDFTIPEVPTNVMLMTISGCACSPSGRSTPPAGTIASTSGSPSVVGAIMGIAFINAQAFVYVQMGMPIADGTYPMFYAITGTMALLVVIGIVFTAVAAFRFLGGRSASASSSRPTPCTGTSCGAFAAVWLVVYVTK
jgi:heme/copper-type cytochrome/quinol oxidase subunit 3